MKIVKIEENKDEIEGTKIYIEHNGVQAFYYLHDTLQYGFHSEILDFQKTFFNYPEAGVSWSDVMEDKDFHDKFESWTYLHSERHILYMIDVMIIIIVIFMKN